MNISTQGRSTKKGHQYKSPESVTLSTEEKYRFHCNKHSDGLSRCRIEAGVSPGYLDFHFRRAIEISKIFKELSLDPVNYIQCSLSTLSKQHLAKMKVSKYY